MTPGNRSPAADPSPRRSAWPRRTAALLATALLSCAAVAGAAETARRKVIIDQDAYGPASSNLQAIALLLGAKDVELLGVTVVSGDGWRDEQVDHALRMLEIAGRRDVPVVPGAVMPLVNSPARTKAWEALYGKLFYKGAFTEKWPDQGVTRRLPHPQDPALVPESPAGRATTKPAAEAAANFLVRKVREFPGQVTVIAAGPMTNLALAARLDPQFASLAQEFVFMGGSFAPVAADNAFAAEYANTPRREFNFRWDPEATAIVLREPWRSITQVPVDPTTKTYFRRELFDEIAKAGTPLARYLAQFGEPYPMWDELAVAVWLDRGLVKRAVPQLVGVETSFTAGYGDTLSWAPAEAPGLGERPVNVVYDVDVPAFERLTVRLLSQAGAR